jgi:hypothetical protein
MPILQVLGDCFRMKSQRLRDLLVRPAFTIEQHCFDSVAYPSISLHAMPLFQALLEVCC